MSSSTQTKPSNTQADTQLDTRSRILEATWKLMEENQVNQGKGVRMSDIAKLTGISRQALYLHFASRTELLVATVRYIDEIRGVEGKLEPWRNATTAEQMIDEFIKFWASHVPEIFPVGKGLLEAKDTDEAAAETWDDRMLLVKNACQRIVNTLSQEGKLSSDLTKKDAVHILWTLLSIRNWEQLTIECGMSKKQYIKHMTRIVKQALVGV